MTRLGSSRIKYGIGISIAVIVCAVVLYMLFMYHPSALRYHGSTSSRVYVSGPVQSNVKFVNISMPSLSARDISLIVAYFGYTGSDKINIMRIITRVNEPETIKNLTKLLNYALHSRLVLICNPYTDCVRKMRNMTRSYICIEYKLTIPTSLNITISGRTIQFTARSIALCLASRSRSPFDNTNASSSTILVIANVFKHYVFLVNNTNNTLVSLIRNATYHLTYLLHRNYTYFAVLHNVSTIFLKGKYFRPIRNSTEYKFAIKVEGTHVVPMCTLALICPPEGYCYGRCYTYVIEVKFFVNRKYARYLNITSTSTLLCDGRFDCYIIPKEVFLSATGVFTRYFMTAYYTWIILKLSKRPQPNDLVSIVQVRTLRLNYIELTKCSR